MAIGLNIDIPTPEVIRLGGEGHRAIGSPALMVISLAYLNNWREAEII
jgi:hypothetical protein